MRESDENVLFIVDALRRSGYDIEVNNYNNGRRLVGTNLQMMSATVGIIRNPVISSLETQREYVSLFPFVVKKDNYFETVADYREFLRKILIQTTFAYDFSANDQEINRLIKKLSDVMVSHSIALHARVVAMLPSRNQQVQEIVESWIKNKDSSKLDAYQGWARSYGTL